jgi:hypothetical protein
VASLPIGRNGAAPGAVSPPPAVLLTPVAALDPDPESFVTWSVSAENTSADSLDLVIELRTPSSWKAISGLRSLRLGPNATEVVPFTVWIPAQASSDSIHQLEFRAQRAGHEEVLVRLTRETRVTAHSGLSLIGPTLEPSAHPGGGVTLPFHITNTGNRKDTYRITASSLPSWPVHADPHVITLKPGCTGEIRLSLSVPASVRPGTTHLLTVEAASTTKGEIGSASPPATSQVRTHVQAGQASGSQFPRLPLDASTSIGEITPGHLAGGLRASTRGQIAHDAIFDLDLDVTTGAKLEGLEGWQTQRIRLGLTRSTWEASLGDVTRWFPDLAARTLSGRGFGFASLGEPWRARAYVGRDPGPGVSYSWGAGIERTLRSSFRLGGDVLSLEDDTGNRGKRTNRLGCISGVLASPDLVQLRLETAWSRTVDQGLNKDGLAGQIFFDHSGRRLLLRGRIYSGSREFGGRTGDRDGGVSFLRFSINPATRCWLNAETSQGHLYQSRESPVQVSTRCRLGTTVSKPHWPLLEITTGGTTERESAGPSPRELWRGDASLSTTYSAGSILSAATGRWGRAWDRRVDRRGATANYEVSFGGRLAGWKAIAHWNRDIDWIPDSGRTTSLDAVSGELGWNPRAGPIQVGCGGSARRQSAVSGSGRNLDDLRVRPWLEAALAPRLRVSLQATVICLDRTSQIDTWQAQISYSASELVPLLWSPVRGGIAGMVFVDDDHDGEPDPGERRVDGVLLRLEGGHRMSDENGRFEWSAMAPGTYWLELDRGSVTPGMVARGIFPLEIRVDAGRTSQVWIPLAASAQVQGQVFLDDDHDGGRSTWEEGLKDVRIVLLRSTHLVTDCLSDETGEFHLPELAPGDYEVQVAEGWIPFGWVVTGPPTTRVSVAPGQTITLPPIGLAPRSRPIIRTFPR